MYISELQNNRVSIFTTDGEFVKSFGSKGHGPVQFDDPREICLDKNGTMYVCDAGNNRVQIFT